MWRVHFLLMLIGLIMATQTHAAIPLWHRSVAIDERVNPDGTADLIENWSVRADTTAVAHLVAQQSFAVIADLETVELVDAYTQKPGGRRIQVQADAIMDQAVTTLAAAPEFSSQHARTILFPSVAAGDTVHYTLRRHGTASLFPGQFTATLQPGWWRYLDHADITLITPPSMSLRVAATGLAEADPILHDDGSLTRRWHLAQADSGAVTLDVSSFADYAELGRAYAARAWPRSQPGPSIRALAARLTDGITDPHEQALRLYRQVATDIRYVATFLRDGRVVPRDAETVLEQGFGDCKDHAALLQALLAAAGIEAQPALISLRNLYSLPDAPGLGALNHVITYVPALDLYLDSTAPYAAFGLLPAIEYDKPVVLADPESARLARTPALPPAPMEVTTTTAASIGDDDVISGTTTTEAAGPQGIALRSMAAWIEGRGPAGAASVQLRQLGTPGTGGFSFNPPDAGAASYQVHADFRLDEALIDGGDAPFPLPHGLSVLERPGRLLLGTPATEDDRHVCYPGREVEELSLALPPGAEIRTMPHDQSLDAGGAHYEARYWLADGALKVRRIFTVETTRVACSSQAYAEMRGVLGGRPPRPTRPGFLKRGD